MSQPEALRLAASLSLEHPSAPGAKTKYQAAAELRRLRTENERLRGVLEEIGRYDDTSAKTKAATARAALESIK